VPVGAAVGAPPGPRLYGPPLAAYPSRRFFFFEQGPAMRITIFGSGYVGLVTGACLADAGNHVVCVDVDPAKVERLNRGELPIHEPGLDEVIRRNQAKGRLKFTLDAAEAVAQGLFQIIAVGTPPDEDGSADLRHVLAVATTIADHMNDYKVVITKSTVPVGTADTVRAALTAALAARGAALEFDVVSNPEFLKEGAAISDFMRPDRVIVGTDNPRVAELVRALYEPFTRNHDRLIVMDIRSAELTKYAANAMLATKISFMNEMANLAERFGADIERVRVGIGSDPRIGYGFIYPGAGYGGSCFPKDVQALERSGRAVGYEPKILAAVETVNAYQKTVLFGKIKAHFRNQLRARSFALWGLAFKPNTDDMREAPSRVLIEALLAAGATVRAYDPVAMPQARRVLGERVGLVYAASMEEALAGADALAIVTEWQEFRSPDFDAIKAALREPAIFDGRNLYDPALMKRFGFTYYGIGRGATLPAADA
jgi:UDPglucose 6-dehydrogenase